MNIEQIENNLTGLLNNFRKEEFIFDLLFSYGLPKATISLLKRGQHNLSKEEGTIILKRKLFFQDIENADLHETIDSLQKDPSTMRYSPRFILVTDYKTLLSIDTKTNEHLDIPIKSIIKHYDFFLPWAGIEKHRYVNENPADRKAAERMARLYDEIHVENNIKDEKKNHDLNVFLARLLFCFFAEDTNIFDDKLFTNSIASHTQTDGSDFGSYLDNLFKVLNTKERSKFPEYLKKFPYVNGGLFAKKHWIPKFTSLSRKIIIECGELNWSKINPDIFGSMMQAVVQLNERGSLGMHYTSVPNIMKVIEPLFLDNLKEEFENNKGNVKKLQQLIYRISHIKIFDPACGSGNFLIITYKELRRLEMEIIKELGMFAFSCLNLSQFYGIEIDDFAHEISKLSLHLAEHQMNIQFLQEFGRVNPTLPLKTGGNIICANACQVDWSEVCPKNIDDEIYILGNPPYLGSKFQEDSQKDDMKNLFSKFEKFSNLDYVSCWFYKSAQYLETNIKSAFVTTNSISQGTQVDDLWPHIFNLNVEIGFAVKDFLWTNNAKNNAGVMCSIIGLRTFSKDIKYIYNNNLRQSVSNINGYLLDAPNVFIRKRTFPLSKLPQMIQGNIPLDNGYLRLNDQEKNEIIKKYPNSHFLFRKVSGSKELINDIQRWCLWINDDNLKLALSIEPIKNRIEKVKIFRSNGATNAKACLDRSHQFCMLNVAKKNQIIIPIVSSIKRTYIPISFLESDYIIMNSALVIYDAEPYIFGILTSKIHTVWAKAIAGKLKSDFRYSVGLCWYSYPLPLLTNKQKKEINTHVYNILEEREKYSEKTLADLYDPAKMPTDLKEAHNGLDLAVERCYRSKIFTSDDERLKYLFNLFEQMIKEEETHKINN